MLRFPSPRCRHDREERPRRRKVQESPLDCRQRHGYLHSHRVSVPGLHLPLFVNVFLHASADPGLFPTIPPVYSHTPPFQLSAFYPHSFLAHPKPWHRAVVLFPRGFDLRSALMSWEQMTCREFIPKDAVVDYDNLQLSLKVRRASPFCHSKLQISWVLFSSADLFANAFLPRFFFIVYLENIHFGRLIALVDWFSTHFTWRLHSWPCPWHNLVTNLSLLGPDLANLGIRITPFLMCLYVAS